MTPDGQPSSFAAALAIARRDLLEFVRDRRTLVITLLLPMVMYPLLALATALGLRTATHEIEARSAPATVHLGLSGPDAPGLAALVGRTLERTPESDRAGWPAGVACLEVEESAAGRALDEGAIDLWIDAPRGLLADLVSTGSVRLAARVSAKRPASQPLRQQFQAFMRSFARDVARARVARAGLPATLLEPVDVAFTGDEGAGPPPAHDVLAPLAGGVLVLLTVLTLTGAFYPAIDAIAGEKERGTIETLLIAPCRLSDVVLGKFLGVFAITLATLAANVVSIAATAAVTVRSLPAGLSAALPAGPLAVAAAAAVVAFTGMAAVAAATCLAVTTASKSGKEAQNTLTPVILLVSAVAGAVLLPGTRGGPLLAAVPFAGQIAVTKAALGSAAAPPAPAATVLVMLGVSLASAGLVTWLLLQLTAHALADEDVLFRGQDVAGAALHRPAPRSRPNPVQAFLPILAGFAGIWYSQGLAPADLRLAIPLQQAVAVLGPLALLLWWQRVDLRTTFSLRWPGRGAGSAALILGAALLGASLFVIGAAVLLQVRSAGLTDEARRLSARLIELITREPWWLGWSLVAVVPAVCEELLFRGWMLAGLLGRSHLPARVWAAVVVQAAAFALFHLLPERMPQTFVVGLVLGWLVVRTHSLLPAVICHLAHNSTPLAILALAGDVPGLGAAVEQGDTSTLAPLPGWGVAGAVVALVAAATRRGPGRARP